MRGAARRHEQLPITMRQPEVRQRKIYNHLVGEAGVGQLRRWLLRWLRTILGGAPDAGEHELGLSLVHALCETLPLCVALDTAQSHVECMAHEPAHRCHPEWVQLVV